MTSTPKGLEEAATTGVLRAVAVADGRVVSVKPVRGAVVLEDLMREHFRGCLLVLVRGGEDLVRLRADGDCWQLRTPAGAALRRSTTELLDSLGRPSFWRRLEAPPGAVSD